MDDSQLLRYSRHILLDEIGIEGQEKLLQSHAIVIGCGGLGSAALPYLAASGIGRLTVADPDTVDETNLQRQIMFTEADIGRNKAEIMAGRLKTLNGAVKIDVLAERLTETRLTALLHEADILLDCCDNFATRLAANRASVAARKPLVSGAAVRFEGQIAVYRPDLPAAPCYACLFDADTADDGACALFGVFSPLVGIIGASQAAEALKILSGAGTAAHNCLHTYDALSGRWRQFQFEKNPDCRVCSGTAGNLCRQAQP